MSDKVIPVKVAVRARPLIPKEEREGCTTCLQFVAEEPQLILGTNKAFTYDYVFSPCTPQGQVYEKAAASLVQAIFKGKHIILLVYCVAYLFLSYFQLLI